MIACFLKHEEEYDIIENSSKHLCNFWNTMADVLVVFGPTLPVCQRASEHILKNILQSRII